MTRDTLQVLALRKTVSDLKDQNALLNAERAKDEALLRQALEALGRAHQTAMEQTIKARIPECAEFAGIAQDLDFVVAALEGKA